MKLENNKLIAEFMGLVVSNSEDYSSELYTNVDVDLKFNSSWDWLMPVVEKIINLNISVCISDEGCDITEKFSNGKLKSKAIVGAATSDYQSLIEAIYNAVVEFIKWYNENKGE